MVDHLLFHLLNHQILVNHEDVDLQTDPDIIALKKQAAALQAKVDAQARKKKEMEQAAFRQAQLFAEQQRKAKEAEAAEAKRRADAKKKEMERLKQQIAGLTQHAQKLDADISSLSDRSVQILLDKDNNNAIILDSPLNPNARIQTNNNRNNTNNNQWWNMQHMNRRHHSESGSNANLGVNNNQDVGNKSPLNVNRNTSVKVDDKSNERKLGKPIINDASIAKARHGNKQLRHYYFAHKNAPTEQIQATEKYKKKYKPVTGAALSLWPTIAEYTVPQLHKDIRGIDNVVEFTPIPDTLMDAFLPSGPNQLSFSQFRPMLSPTHPVTGFGGTWGQPIKKTLHANTSMRVIGTFDVNKDAKFINQMGVGLEFEVQEVPELAPLIQCLDEMIGVEEGDSYCRFLQFMVRAKEGAGLDDMLIYFHRLTPAMNKAYPALLVEFNGIEDVNFKSYQTKHDNPDSPSVEMTVKMTEKVLLIVGGYYDKLAWGAKHAPYNIDPNVPTCYCWIFVPQRWEVISALDDAQFKENFRKKQHSKVMAQKPKARRLDTYFKNAVVPKTKEYSQRNIYSITY